MQDNLTPTQALWANATSKSISWPAKDKADAHRRRFQLYNMRRKWRRANDPFATIADLVEVVVEQDNAGQWWTRLQPSGFRLNELLATGWTSIDGGPALPPQPQQPDPIDAKILRRLEVTDWLNARGEKDLTFPYMEALALLQNLGDVDLGEFRKQLSAHGID